MITNATRRPRRNRAPGRTPPPPSPGRLAASLAALALGAAACGFSEPALEPVTLAPLTRVVVPPVEGQTANFDVMAIDEDGHRLYVSDANDRGVDVIDVSTPAGRYLDTIHLGAVPKGVAYVPELHRLFTGNADSTVSVIDTDPGAGHPYPVVATIDTNGKGSADLLDYDPRDRKLYVTNPDDGFVTAIHAAGTTAGRIAGQITGLGFVEQPRYNPADGMVYVPSADRNSLFQVNPRTDSVVREYPLPVVCEPHGLAINPAIDQGLIGCGDKDDQVALVWDFATARVVRSSDLAGAGDAVIFDAQAQHFYFAAQGFTPPEIAVFNAAPITFLTAVPTSHRSHTVAYDEAHRLVYTFDGRHLGAALWAFADPVAGCVGAEAARAAAGAPRSRTPDCHPTATSAGH